MKVTLGTPFMWIDEQLPCGNRYYIQFTNDRTTPTFPCLVGKVGTESTDCPRACKSITFDQDFLAKYNTKS